MVNVYRAWPVVEKMSSNPPIESTLCLMKSVPWFTFTIILHFRNLRSVCPSHGFVWIYIARIICVCEHIAMHSLTSIYRDRH